MSEVTQILSAIEQGDPRAAERLLPLVYDELRKLAAARLAREKPGQTLEASALVHEAYLRLVGRGQDEQWASRGHFFGAAAEAMRRILIESARRKGRIKRGGALTRVALDDVPMPQDTEEGELLALDEALDKLASADEVAAKLVQLRYFAGLPIADAASALGVSPRTADRLWAYARAFIHSELSGD